MSDMSVADVGQYVSLLEVARAERDAAEALIAQLAERLVVAEAENHRLQALLASHAGVLRCLEEAATVRKGQLT